MTVLLINPPYSLPKRSRSTYLHTWPPLGLAYLAAGLQAEGESVQLIDAVAESLTPDTVLERALASDVPDIVGMTVMAATFAHTLTLARAFKSLTPPPLIVVGGSHATFAAEDTLQHSEIDVVVLGEGDVTVRELIRAARANASLTSVAGLALRQDGHIFRTAARPLVDNLDRLPWPARDLLPMQHYRRGDGKVLATLISSRGCPYRCAYCCEHRFWQGQWRARSAGNVVAELVDVVERYRPDLVLFLDDAFTIDAARAHTICHEIERRGLRVRWGCQSRVDRVDADLLQHMQAAGCTSIGFGIESGVQSILDCVGRRTTLEQTRAAVNAAQAAGLRTIGYFMLGLPGETEATMEATVSFACSVGLSEAWFSIATPYPGTELYERAENFGLQLLPTDWTDYDFTCATCRVTGLEPDAIQRKLGEAYRRFYG